MLVGGYSGAGSRKEAPSPHPLLAEPVPIAQGSVRLPAPTDLRYVGTRWLAKPSKHGQAKYTGWGPRELRESLPSTK